MKSGKKTLPLRQKGFSLIEFMVASVIGLLILFAIAQVFIAARVGYQLANGKALMQESGRVGIEVMQRDLRMAGYAGCTNDGARLRGLEYSVRLPGAVNPQQFTGVNFANNFSRGIEGFEADDTAPGELFDLDATAGTWTPALPPQLRGLPLPGSDVLIVRYLGPSRARLTSFSPNIGGPDITIETNPNGLTRVNGGQVYALSNCNLASFFVAGDVNVDGDALKATGLTGAEFFDINNSYLYEVTRVAYYVGRQPNGRVGLFRLNLQETPFVPEEVYAPDIVALQVTYGWDISVPLPDGAIDREGTAADMVGIAINGEEVYSRIAQVRVGILLAQNGGRRSSENENPDRVINLLGTNLRVPAVGENEDRIYSTYEIVAAPRNHLFGY